MKRIITLLLSLLLLFTAIVPALAVRGETPPAKISKLTVSTGGKAKQLVLKWSAVPGADGYQIYRSTTGKRGSYQKIADKSGTSYTNTGLKHGATYYYAIRAYARNGKKTLCGPWKKANLSTRMTKAYASARFTQAWKAMDRFVSAYDQRALDRGQAFEKIRGDWYGYYFPFTLKGCKTKADAVTYLSSYFTKASAKKMVNFFLKVMNKKLYIWLPQDPGVLGALVINDVPTLKIAYSDRRVVCKFGTWFVPAYGAEGDPLTYAVQKVAMQYERGHWFFTDENWYQFGYPYTTRITPNDGK